MDVFTDTPYFGNPVAVVLGADGLSGEQMQLFARWTNLSETTFVLAPRASGADYQVRIFTPARELPFAGHPTLGTCHAWLEAGGRPADPDSVVQECEAGLITVRRDPGGEAGLAFAAPPLVRSGRVDEDVTERVTRALNLDRSDIVDIAWADNGPGWVAVLLASAEAVLAVRCPATVDLDIGVAGPYPGGSPEAIEVRAFSPMITSIEDPVTGSLNASLGQWLLASGRVTAPYVASQGTAMGRRGRVHISRDADGQVWVGGGAVTCVSGTVELLSLVPRAR
ncbi:MAG TPA: PhzF family phenazine biosynthesis protein [Streptosporangiaceae bacterium]|nr:PhzF family phenazine biosynthesis protein [Streptosporangiaceae bacterium]